MLENFVRLACSNFADEGIIDEMFAEAKVIRLGKIEEDIRKNVTELESQVIPSTLLEVLEERRMTIAKAVKKI